MKTVWIYVDTSKDVGDLDHLKVFATPEAADEWFKEHDPEGVVFEYRRPAGHQHPQCIVSALARLAQT
jgi:hypothetical protein